MIADRILKKYIQLVGNYMSRLCRLFVKTNTYDQIHSQSLLLHDSSSNSDEPEAILEMYTPFFLK